MGDRIEIKDSVIMGNVSTGGNSGGYSEECCVCRKTGNFVRYLCKECDNRFCKDCSGGRSGLDYLKNLKRCYNCDQIVKRNLENYQPQIRTRFLPFLYKEQVVEVVMTS